MMFGPSLCKQFILFFICVVLFFGSLMLSKHFNQRFEEMFMQFAVQRISGHKELI
jgi:hypothetical protein